jgi:hypothetical protein
VFPIQIVHTGAWLLMAVAAILPDGTCDTAIDAETRRIQSPPENRVRPALGFPEQPHASVIEAHRSGEKSEDRI